MTATMLAAARRFPLLGRPRPSCPSLPTRVQEIAAIARAAGHDDTDGLAEAAHALNKAALLASDCGMTDLARDLCWRHIDIYRATDHPLTVLQARYLLEPVLNLARLRIRANDGEQALRLLTSMHHAATSNTDLIIEEHTLPLANLIGTRQQRRKLREWVWLHLLGDGIRALALAGRWDDAVTHARAHRGIGLHLMEGRQAMIVAHCLNQAPEAARAALAESTPEQPWEHQVAACLNVMCATTDTTSPRPDTATMIRRFAEEEPTPGYAVFRTQLGITVTTLARTTDPVAADHVFAQVVDEAVRANDGYAAREVLRYRDTHKADLTSKQDQALADQLASSGLGPGTLPRPLLNALLNSTDTAAQALNATLSLYD